MPKHNKIKHQARGNLPAPRIPHPVQNRILRENNQELKRVLNKVQRLLWLAVHNAKGIISVPIGDYQMAMQTPDEDCITSTEVIDDGKTVVIVFTDATGKRLPESEQKLVIATDDA